MTENFWVVPHFSGFIERARAYVGSSAAVGFEKVGAGDRAPKKWWEPDMSGNRNG